MVTPVITKDDTEQIVGTAIIVTDELVKQEQCQEDDEEDEEDEEEHQKHQSFQGADTDDNIRLLSMQ